MATSLKNRTFTTLANQNDGVLGDDYVHSALETWKLKGKTSTGGKWDYKAKIKHSQKDGQLSGTLDDELKVQFPYNSLYFMFRSKRNGDLKLHLDLGEYSVSGQNINLFTNLKTGINFKNFAVRFGANQFSKNFEASTGIETLTNNNSHTATNLTSRFFYRKDNTFYALVTSFGLGSGIALKTYNALLGYEKDNTNLYLEHKSNPKASQVALGTLVGTVTSRRDNQEFGVQVTQDFQKNTSAAVIGGSTKCGDATVKAKVNQNLDLELSYKKAINKQLTLTTSGKLALSKGAGAVDFSQIIPLPLGFQFEVNV